MWFYLLYPNSMHYFLLVLPNQRKIFQKKSVPIWLVGCNKSYFRLWNVEQTIFLSFLFGFCNRTDEIFYAKIFSSMCMFTMTMPLWKSQSNFFFFQLKKRMTKWPNDKGYTTTIHRNYCELVTILYKIVYIFALLSTDRKLQIHFVCVFLSATRYVCTWRQCNQARSMDSMLRVFSLPFFCVCLCFGRIDT